MRFLASEMSIIVNIAMASDLWLVIFVALFMVACIFIGSFLVEFFEDDDDDHFI